MRISTRSRVKLNDYDLVAVMADGERVTINSRVQLMIMRRLTSTWEDMAGNSVHYSVPGELLKTHYGFYV